MTTQQRKTLAEKLESIKFDLAVGKATKEQMPLIIYTVCKIIQQILMDNLDYREEDIY